MNAAETNAPSRRLAGVHAATVCPLNEDETIDRDGLGAHLRRVTTVAGIGGLLLNGHAGEGARLTDAERAEVIRTARRIGGASCHLTAGVHGESSAEAARQAIEARDAGADAVLVFPPPSWALGCDLSMIVAHHRFVADRCGLPILLYRAPVTSHGLHYPVDIVLRLVEDRRIVGIKEGSWEIAAYEELRRAVHRERPDIMVLASGDEHLLTGYLIGSEGSQVSLAAIVPEAVIRLYDAAQSNDLAAAKCEAEKLYPLAVAIYRNTPGYHATARIKTALTLIGEIGCDQLKAPWGRTPVTEVEDLRHALVAAGALPAFIVAE